MRTVMHTAHEELTFLALVLPLHGEFRSRLALIRVTPLQAGLLLFLRRHADATLTDAAAAVSVKLPTLSAVLQDLVRKRLVTKHRSVTDTRDLCLTVRRRGEALAQRIKGQVRHVKSDVTHLKETFA
jgi:DNA-binding MarR family transcriptional regulator